MAAVRRGSLSRRELLRGSGQAALAGIVGLLAGSGPLDSVWAEPSGTRGQALEILRGIIHRHTRNRQDAYAVVHGVRAMGTEWKVADGARAVDHVLATVVKRRTVGLRQHLYVPLDIEMHQNSFLETFLDSGVRWEQPVRVENQTYSFRDLFEHAKMVFSFSNGNATGAAARMHRREKDWFAWSLIAFPFGVPPQKDGWRNALGEEVRVTDITAMGFQMMEEATAPVAQAMQRGERLREKVGVHSLTSGGAHLLSGLISAVQHGYTQGNEGRRLARQLDILVFRLSTELQLIDAFYRQGQAHPLAQVYELDTRLYFLGHALGNLTVARRRGLFRPTTAQQGQIQEAEAALYRTIDGLTAVDLEKIRKMDRRLFHRVVADSCYAYQALRLT